MSHINCHPVTEAPQPVLPASLEDGTSSSPRGGRCLLLLFFSVMLITFISPSCSPQEDATLSVSCEGDGPHPGTTSGPGPTGGDTTTTTRAPGPGGVEPTMGTIFNHLPP